MPDASVLIGMPSHGTMPTKACMSIAGIAKATKVPTGFLVVEGSILPQNREVLVAVAMRDHYSHLFFLDSDILCDGDAINRLLAHDKEIVGAPYYKRGIPSYPVVMEKRDDGLVHSIGSPGGSGMPTELFTCYAQGLGCVLIEMSVFRKILRPWFSYVFNPDGSLVHGEDIYFFDKVREAGIPIWCDPTMKVRHIGDYVYPNRD